MRHEIVPIFQFGRILTTLKYLRVEIIRIRLVPNKKTTRAHRPTLLIEIDHPTVGKPDSIGGIIERAGGPYRPVHEIGARVLCIFVVVENVMHGKLADLNG